jgi:hypothetical protein
MMADGQVGLRIMSRAPVRGATPAGAGMSEQSYRKQLREQALAIGECIVATGSGVRNCHARCRGAACGYA